MSFAFGRMQAFIKNSYGLNFNDVEKNSIGKYILSKYIEFVDAISTTNEDTSDHDRGSDHDHPYSVYHNNGTEMNP